jgi:DNA processing protein
MKSVTPLPEALKILPKPPKKLYYTGNLDLLQKPLLSIVGTRRPQAYTKSMTLQLSQRFASIGYGIVSGAAMGVDAIAHKGAFPNTIAVMANGLDIYYPHVNRKLIASMMEQSLVLSEYEEGMPATKYSFVVRNRIVVALGEFLIITEADEKSGTMRSAEIAQQLGKKIYVLPHRIGESEGTRRLLKEGVAEPIWDIDDFVSQFGEVIQEEDELLRFCQEIPSLEAVRKRFGDQVFTYELEGKVEIKNLKVYPL